MAKVKQLTEGKVSKGGQNPPNKSRKRPPAPGGSGGKPKPCKCIEAVNKALAPQNAELDTHFTFGGIYDKTVSIGQAMHLTVRKVDTAKKTKLPSLCPTYCPFCGTKLIDEEAAASAH
jgi:hypothetical protein